VVKKVAITSTAESNIFRKYLNQKLDISNGERMKAIDNSLGNSEATGLNICYTFFCSGLLFLPEDIPYLLQFQSDSTNASG